jgi:hypothetical protein
VIITVEKGDIQPVVRRKAKQLKIILLKTGTSSLHQSYTPKLSPQPHSLLTFGLLNLKLSFNPSRA